MNDTDRFRSETLALRILATAAILGLIVLGRDVLVPIALAAMAAFVLAPVVRQIRRLGLGQTGASDRKSTRLNSSHIPLSRMPSSA